MAEEKVVLEIDIKGTQDAIRLKEEVKGLKKEIKNLDETSETFTEDFGKLTQKLAETEAELKIARKAAREFQKSLISVSESAKPYDKLTNRLSLARNALKNLAAEGKTNTKQFQLLQKEVTDLDKKLKGIDASVGQFQRNVGNYSSALQFAGRRTQKFGKLAATLSPDLALLSGGFLAVASNLPQLIEGLNNAVDSFDSWLTASDAGIQLNKRFVEGLEDVSGEFINGKAQIDALIKSAQNENLTLEEQIAIREELVEVVGDNITEAEKEIILNGELAKAQDTATQALIRNLAIQEQRRVLADIIKEFTDAQVEALKTQEKFSKGIRGGFNDLTSFLTGGVFDINNLSKLTAQQTRENLKAQAAGIEQIGKQTTQFLTELNQDFAEAGLDLSFLAGENAEEAAREARERAEKEQAKAEENANKARERQRKEIQRQNERLLKEQEKRLEAARKAQEKAIKDSEKFFADSEKSFLQVSAAVLDQQIKNLEEGEAKRIRIIEENARKREESVKASEAALVAAQKEALLQIEEAFGKGSDKAIEFSQKSAEEIAKIQKQNALLIEEIEREKQKKISEIQIEEQKKRDSEEFRQLKANQAAISTELDRTIKENNLKAIKNNDFKNKAILANEEATIQTIEEQIKQLNKQEEALGKLQIENKEEELQKIKDQRLDLNLELAKIEEEQTAKTIEESKKRADATIKAFETVAQIVGQSFQLITQINEKALEKQLEFFQEQEQLSKETSEKLQEDLSKASGIEKKFLQKRLEEEERTQKAIGEAKEREQKRFAKGQKTLALIQAAINGALAITKVLAEVIDPTPVQAFRFGAVAAVAAATALQIAAIAAQPLAEGGLVGIPDAGGRGGRVGANIRGRSVPSLSNGDDQVVTLRTGEAVLTREQQVKIGGAAALASAGVPSFVSGGKIGSVSSSLIAPNITSGSLSTGAEQRNESFLALISQQQRTLQQTIDKINDQEVIYSNNTEIDRQKAAQDKREIRFKASF